MHTDICSIGKAKIIRYCLLNQNYEILDVGNL